MELRISPEPDDAEREAIVAALTADAAERPVPSAWSRELLPRRDDAEDAQA